MKETALRKDAEYIIRAALEAARPHTAVGKALEEADLGEGRLILIAAGKAAWEMAKAAGDRLGDRIRGGIVITKYGHSRGPLPGLTVREAGHPVPDENSFRAAREALAAVEGLTAEDTVLFLLSGGGSALFELPLIPPEDLTRLTEELLASGADIVEMNTVRKRFSAVKGGRFAARCAPARVISVVLSDVIGDPLDMIASGPTVPDPTTGEQAAAIAEKYGLTLTEKMRELLKQETPKVLSNAEAHVTGNVKQLCLAAENACRELGYRPLTLTASLSCTARDAGVFLGNIAQYHRDTEESLAFLAGGETVVRLTGPGLGGRNQELALAAAGALEGIPGAALFSLGSDGTDGPTDAAGGYVDSSTAAELRAKGVEISRVLRDNDAYHALEQCGGLLMTGPTGTNVNDVAVLLLKRDRDSVSLAIEGQV